MPDRRRAIRRRARNIRKANQPETTAKDQMQMGLVILVILIILVAALYVTDTI